MEKEMLTLAHKAEILVEALPYIQKFAGKRIVIKYGGNAMLNEELTHKVLQDIALLKYIGLNPIVVHGGGPEINKTLKALGIKSQFSGGLRVTDAPTMEVVQMVLAGKINQEIVSKLNALGAKAIGLCGKDASLLQAEKLPPKNGVDLGFVGRVTGVNTNLLTLLSDDEYIPVVAPIGAGKNGESYNINADTAAAEIASAIQAEKLMFLTDVDGIRTWAEDASTLIPVIGIEEVCKMIDDGSICGGMIPKVQGCIDSLRKGVQRTHILDGTLPHPLLLEIFTQKGIGTMVVKEHEK